MKKMWRKNSKVREFFSKCNIFRKKMIKSRSHSSSHQTKMLAHLRLVAKKCLKRGPIPQDGVDNTSLMSRSLHEGQVYRWMAWSDGD